MSSIHARVDGSPPRSRPPSAQGAASSPVARARSGCPAPARSRARAGRRAPCASSRAIARPSPVPPPSPDQNGPEDPLRAPARSPALCPRPPPPPRRSSDASPRSTRPPSGVQWSAFESRFETICRTRSPSVTITGARRRARGRSRSTAPSPLPRTSRRRARRGPHVDLLPQERETARVELGEVEDVTDEALEPRASSATPRATAAAAPRPRTRPLAARRLAADRCQRRAQLVRHRHEEVAGELSDSESRAVISWNRAASRSTSLPQVRSGTATS